MTMRERVDAFLDHLMVEKDFSGNTTAAYQNDLTQLADFMAAHKNSTDGAVRWEAVDRATLSEYIIHLRNERGYAPTTVARKVAAVKSFFAFLLEEGIVKADPTEELSAPKVGRSLPKPISPEAVALLLQQPAKRNTPEAKRDQAMLELLYASGMRVSELVSLNLPDVATQSGQGQVRCLGKGRKERIIPIHDQAVDVLKHYVEDARPDLLRQDANEQALFLNRRGDRLTRQGFWLILKNYAKAANIQGDVTPHTLRHSFATHMLQGGSNLREVQELLGHANISTTQVYTQLTTDFVRGEYDKAHPRAS
ncbi:MAG: site-specific tyrosine recombinase XerD [Dehalococcoidia bacterium]|nr:site-specific tyrosine recombinase XerD [Dehalococcoidia bacterium]